MKIFGLLLLLVLSWSACIGLDVNDFESDCNYSEDIRTTVPAENINIIRVSASTGDLRIRQNKDNPVVDIYGFACSVSRSNLDNINLITEVDSSEMQITADLSQVRHSASLDLSIRVPENTRLIITDSSGDILIENMRNDIYLEDGSGNIQIYDIAGWITLTDGSGNIELKNIHDNITIEADGSGNINIIQVDGDVYIIEDGPGNIVVSNVLGDFTVEKAGSGNLSYSNITGQVVLP